MSKIAVVTDSSAYLPPELVERYDIHVIPLRLLWDGVTLLDGVTIDPPAFYEQLSRSRTLPTSSQPSTGEFTDFFTDVARDADGIVGIFISSGLSGTVASALAARELLPELSIEVVDSLATTTGLGLVTLAAARAAADGKALPEVADAARNVIPRLNTFFVVETLKYLHKGGRIGGASRFLGSVVGIKPLLHLNNGRIDALEKVRTKHKAVNRMKALMVERVSEGAVSAGVFHANVPEEAKEISGWITEHFDCREILMSDLSPVIGAHVGPGVVGMAFYVEDED